MVKKIMPGHKRRKTKVTRKRDSRGVVVSYEKANYIRQHLADEFARDEAPIPFYLDNHGVAHNEEWMLRKQLKKRR